MDNFVCVLKLTKHSNKTGKIDKVHTKKYFVIVLQTFQRRVISSGVFKAWSIIICLDSTPKSFQWNRKKNVWMRVWTKGVSSATPPSCGITTWRVRSATPASRYFKLNCRKYWTEVVLTTLRITAQKVQRTLPPSCAITRIVHYENLLNGSVDMIQQ